PHVGESVPWPYGGWYLGAMDADGGWVASAVGPGRFGSSLDGLAPRCIPSPGSLRGAFSRPPRRARFGSSGRPNSAYYTFRWDVVLDGPGGRVNTWHTGSLDGTSTILVRRHDGLAWAVLFNSRETAQGNDPVGEIDPLVHGAANEVRSWPEGDL